MRGSLLESRKTRRQGPAGTAASVAAHAALIALAVAATGRAAAPPDEPAPPKLHFVVPPPAAPTPTAAAPSAPAGATEARAAPAAAPASIPLPIVPSLPSVPGPAIDLASRPVVDAGDFAKGGLATAGGAGPGLGSGDGVFDERAVEEPAAALPGNPVPRYPEVLRAAATAGRVTVRFVVDTLGRVEGGSLVVAAADHPLFAEAVRSAGPRMRFRPARVRGRPVRQLVELPVVFGVTP